MCLITRGEATRENYHRTSRQILDIIKVAIDLDVPLIQIREKQLTTRLTFELVKQAVYLARGTHTRILVNDRSDIALAAGAHGVHLTSRSMSADIVRGRLPEGSIIGVSAHSDLEAAAAARAGADFIILGPVFKTPEKSAPLLPAVFAKICASTPVPVLGVGGVEPSNARDVLVAGAAGVAAIRSLNDPVGLSAAVEAIRK